MSQPTQARRTELRLTLDGKDVTQDLMPYVQSLTYTDHESDKTDDLQLVLDDRDGVWMGGWLNRDENNKTGTGTELTAGILPQNWNSDGRDAVLDCGVFCVDSVDASGPPAIVSIGAGSVPFASTARTEKKTRAWEHCTLSSIAEDIAKGCGLAYLYLAKDNPSYSRKEQASVSDMIFLQTLCHNAGLSIKVTANTIVLFDAAEYEQKEAVRTLQKGVSGYTRYSFSTELQGKDYVKCTVTYTDPKTQKTFKGVFNPSGDSKATGQTLSIRDEAVYSDTEANKLAKKRLREKNKQRFGATFSMLGDTGLVAGVTILVKGWGAFDGKYIVETAKHTVSTGGYRTDITCRRVLEGY